MTRQTFLKLLKTLPVKVPLKSKILESIDYPLYTQHKVEYAVEKNERVKAYLLIPKNLKDGVPAIFCYHQHAGNFSLGKSEVVGLDGDPNQAYAKELAEQGFITFAPDAIAFEERNWSDEPGKAEYFELTTRIIQGQTLLGKVLHDMSVGIDYLTTVRGVDKNKIGFIGHSYGGRMAIWGPVFDERIKASVSNCGCVSYKDSMSKDVGIQMEFVVPDILKYGDVEDVAKLVEPCSLLISATTEDKYSIGARKIYNYAKASFKKGTFTLKLYEGAHIFNKEMRAYSYSWLKQYLSGK